MIIHNMKNEINIQEASKFLLKSFKQSEFKEIILEDNINDGIIESYRKGEWYLTYDLDNNEIHVSYHKIYSILKSKYELNNKEIKELCKKMVKRVFKRKEFEVPTYRVLKHRKKHKNITSKLNIIK